MVQISLMVTLGTLFLGGFVIAEDFALSKPVPPQARHGEKLVVVNDDGFSKFYGGHYRSADDLKKHILRYTDSQVAVLEWCFVAGSRVTFPSPNHKLLGEGVESFSRRGDKLAAETLRQLRDSGVDTLEVVAATCREAGISSYASMRMNGDYAAAAWEGGLARMFNSDFWHDHPEFHQGSTANQLRRTYVGGVSENVSGCESVEGSFYISFYRFGLIGNYIKPGDVILKPGSRTVGSTTS